MILNAETTKAKTDTWDFYQISKLWTKRETISRVKKTALQKHEETIYHMSEGVNGQIYKELHSKEKITQNVQKIWKDSLQNTPVKSQ